MYVLVASKINHDDYVKLITKVTNLVLKCSSSEEVQFTFTAEKLEQLIYTYDNIQYLFSS